MRAGLERARAVIEEFDVHHFVDTNDENISHSTYTTPDLQDHGKQFQLLMV